jgi:YD repeat-containing protein
MASPDSQLCSRRAVTKEQQPEVPSAIVHDAIARFMLSLALAAVIVFSSGATARTQNLTFSYDAAGRLTGVTDASGNNATYSYDKVGNLQSITRTNAPQGQSQPPSNSDIAEAALYGEAFGVSGTPVEALTQAIAAMTSPAVASNAAAAPKRTSSAEDRPLPGGRVLRVSALATRAGESR